MKEDVDLDVKSALRNIADFGGRRNRVQRSLWRAKWLPVIIMLYRWYGVFDFYSNPREIFMDYRENEFAAMWIYTIEYIILPYYIWDKAKNHELCFRWKIPAIYLFALNFEHIYFDSIIITNGMMSFEFILIGLTLLLYLVAFINNQKLKRC